jgi:hypothetical protein
MSDTDTDADTNTPDTPDTDMDMDVDPEQKRQELLDDAQAARAEHEEKQQALVDAVATDDDIGRYDTVELGGVTLKIRLWVPGDQMRGVDASMDAEQLEQSFRSLDDFIDVLVTLTEEIREPGTGDTHADGEFIRGFYNMFFDQYGSDAATVAAQTVIAPVLEEIEDKSDGLQSFQGER